MRRLQCQECAFSKTAYTVLEAVCGNLEEWSVLEQIGMAVNYEAAFY